MRLYVTLRTYEGRESLWGQPSVSRATQEHEVRRVTKFSDKDTTYRIVEFAPTVREPVAWLVRFVHRGDDGATACAVEGTADKLADLYSGKKTPLYEAPPPAAAGVDVAAIRRVVAFMDAAGNQGGLATSLRAAIGEAK